MSSETAEIRRQSVLSTDKVLQTIGGILLTVCMAITGWTVLQVLDLTGRIIRVETKQISDNATMSEVRADVKQILELIHKRP